jgi:predicted transcriptional regulator
MVKPTRQQAIRRLLRQRPDGMTRTQLSEALGIHVANVSTALKAMPDVYVDRWAKAVRGFEKVWCAVYVPEDCPHPKDKVFKGGRGKPRTIWQPVGVLQ